MIKTYCFTLFFIVFLGFVLFFFNGAYREITATSELANCNYIVEDNFQNLSRQINKAEVLNAGLAQAGDSSKAGDGKLSFRDSLIIIRQLEQLNSFVKDSLNIQIAGELDKLVRSELPWILKSNVPYSVNDKKSPGHIASSGKIGTLINEAIQRTSFLTEYYKKQLNKEIRNLKTWMTIFILLSASVLIFTRFNLSRQQSRRKRNEKELETVFNRISDGVVSVDNNWRYTFLNDAALVTHPMGKKETMGKIIWDVHPEMKGTIFWEKYYEAMQTKKVIEIESFYAPMNIWFSVKVYPSGDGLTIFYKNVTESKKAEQELAQSLREITDYKFALDEACIVAITDQKGVIKHANQNFCKISKYSMKELIGQDHRIINSGYHPKEFIRNLWVTIANGRIWKGELKNKAKDGTIYWVDTTIVPLIDGYGKPHQYLAIRADITERKKVEEKIIQLNAELEENVIKRTEELLIANKEMESFTYSVSHDLRAPLRGVIGFASILEEEYGKKLDEEAMRITSIIKNSALKMGHLIDDLLGFSRMGKNEISKTQVNTQEMVNDIIEEQMQQNKWPHKISWNIEILPVINADTNLIRQVWINFISNAIKYSSTRDHPFIEIGSRINKEQIEFYIKDNGVGFDEEYTHKLFKVFQRLHEAEAFEGTGIGLALIEKIVSRHGGKVWAEGKEDRGACFHFSLPF